MAKFVYRMQSILELKGKMEEQARMEFADARMKLDEEEERLTLLQSRKAAYEEEGRSLQKDSLKVREIIQNRDAIATMKGFIDAQQKAVERAGHQLEAARVKLQTAMQESKTQERLKEKAFAEFMKEENAKEAKEVDELVSYTYGQKREK